jgi:hypothetical protein
LIERFIVAEVVSNLHFLEMLRFVALFAFMFALAPCLGLKPIQQQEFHGSMSLEWKDLSYTVLAGQGRKLQKKQILHELSGRAEPGHLVAIMGPTGRSSSQDFIRSSLPFSPRYSLL